MKKAISLLLVFVICLSMCACSQEKAIAKAMDKAGEILNKAVENSQTDLVVSWSLDEKNATVTICGELSPTLQNLIDAAKRNTSIASWLRDGMIERYKEEQISADSKAQAFFWSLMTSETAEQIQACFGNLHIKIIYEYEDINNHSTSKVYDK